MDGVIAWAIRKDSPKLKAVLEEIIPHSTGKGLQKAIYEQFARDAKKMRNARDGADLRRIWASQKRKPKQLIGGTMREEVRYGQGKGDHGQRQLLGITRKRGHSCANMASTERMNQRWGSRLRFGCF